MANPIQRVVSKKKRRFVADGFDLDLTRITPNVIAMGFPAQKIESLYRNSLTDVIAFFKKYHPDHYYIVNLCSEREYPSSVFEDRVYRVPFDDHNPPRFDQIHPFSKFSKNWLMKDPDNVLAVHCKAGKGRTGLMICCLLIYLNIMPDANAALRMFDAKRTSDNKGVTIPSQRRYVYYYSHIINHGLEYRPTVVRLSGVVVRNLGGPLALGVTISMPSTGKSLKKTYACKEGQQNAVIAINEMVALSGDVRVEFFNRSTWKKNKLFHFWVNTFFLHNAPEYEPDGPGLVEVVRPVHQSARGEDTPCPLHAFVLTLKRSELDHLNREISHNREYRYLQVIAHFSCIDKSCTVCTKERCPYWDVHKSSPPESVIRTSASNTPSASCGLGSSDFLDQPMLNNGSSSVPNSTFNISPHRPARLETDGESSKLNSDELSPSWRRSRSKSSQRLIRHTYLVSADSSDDDIGGRDLTEYGSTRRATVSTSNGKGSGEGLSLTDDRFDEHVSSPAWV